VPALNTVSKQPIRTFWRVAPVALVLSFIPDIAIWAGPRLLTHTTASTVLPLMVMHVAVAASASLCSHASGGTGERRAIPNRPYARSLVTRFARRRPAELPMALPSREVRRCHFLAREPSRRGIVAPPDACRRVRSHPGRSSRSERSPVSRSVFRLDRIRASRSSPCRCSATGLEVVMNDRQFHHLPQRFDVKCDSRSTLAGELGEYLIFELKRSFSSGVKVCHVQASLRADRIRGRPAPDRRLMIPLLSHVMGDPTSQSVSKVVCHQRRVNDGSVSACHRRSGVS